MKRELAFVLQTQCELPAGPSSGRTRASKGSAPTVGSNNDGTSRKKLKAESNGGAPVAIGVDQDKKVTPSQNSDAVLGVYRRTRRHKGAVVVNDLSKDNEGLRDGSEKAVETVIIGETKCNLDEGSLINGGEKPCVSEGGSETVVVDGMKCDLDEGLTKEEARDGRGKTCASEGGSEVAPVVVETLVVDVVKCDLDEDSSKEELRDGCEKPCVREGVAVVAAMAVDESNEVKSVEDVEVAKINGLSCNEVNKVSNGVSVGGPRRLTRSKMNNAEGSSSKINGRGLCAEANVGSVDCATGTETKKLELKMSKKIGLQSRPTTTKELLSTGLLEGYAVVYNGGTKHKVDFLR